MKRPVALAFAVLFASSFMAAQIASPVITAEAYGEHFITQTDTSQRPFVWPVPASNRISSGFLDVRNEGTSIHGAIDIPAPCGTEIIASAAGVVVDTKDGCEHNYPSFCGCNGSTGNRVCIRHEIDGKTYWTVYMHMTDIYVNVGDEVEQGTPIGTVGCTGNSTGSHLDFSIRTNQLWTRNLDEKCDPGYYTQLPHELIFAGSCSCCAEWLAEVAAGTPQMISVSVDALNQVNAIPVPTESGSAVTSHPAEPIHTSVSAVSSTTMTSTTFAETVSSEETAALTEMTEQPAVSQTESTTSEEVILSSALTTVSTSASAAITESSAAQETAESVQSEKAENIEPEPQSAITITDATCPTGTRILGRGFGVHGVIRSQYPLTRVWGGIYNPDGTPTAQFCDVNPNCCEYDLRSYIDERLVFNELAEGNYTFRIEAQDERGYSAVVSESEFSIAKYTAPVISQEQQTFITGDINRDNKITVADSVMLARIIAEDTALQVTAENLAAADADGDGELTVNDITFTLKLLSESGSSAV